MSRPSSTPSLSVSWVRDGKTIRGPQVTMTRGQWTATSQLRMDELREDQFGRYGCLAESEEGPNFQDFRTISLESAEDPVSVTVILVVSGFLVLTLLVLGLAGYIVLMKKQKRKFDSLILPPQLPPAQNRFFELMLQSFKLCCSQIWKTQSSQQRRGPFCRSIEHESERGAW